MKYKYLVLVLLCASIALPGVLSAAEYLPKDSTQKENVVVNDSYRNLYVGGSTVIINAATLGDLFVAGSTVSVSAPTEEDLFVAGGTVTVNAPVTGDARIVGGTVLINAPISGDVLIAGGTVSFGKEALVGGDVWVAGGDINLSNKISGALKITAERIYLGGEVLGESTLWASRKLTFGGSSLMQNTITYHGDKNPVIEEGAQIGTVTRLPFTQNEYSPSTQTGPAATTTFILAITLFVLYKLMRTQTKRVMELTTEGFGLNVLWGAIGVILIPLTSILLMVTIVGAGIGIVLLISYFALMLVASALGLGVIGYYIEKLLRINKEGISYRTLLWGALGSFGLSMIPVVGPVASLVFFLAAFGSILKRLKAKINS
ncbi:MAG: hypothetical protein ACKOW9_06550 [Candidatus Paceibacterota bacterium]